MGLAAVKCNDNREALFNFVDPYHDAGRLSSERGLGGVLLGDYCTVPEGTSFSDHLRWPEHSLAS